MFEKPTNTINRFSKLKRAQKTSVFLRENERERERERYSRVRRFSYRKFASKDDGRKMFVHIFEFKLELSLYE